MREDKPLCNTNAISHKICCHRRMRRNRKSNWIREMVREHRLSVSDLILPIFLTSGEKTVESINSMPDVMRMSIDVAVEKIKQVADLGIPAIAIFPNIPMDLRNNTGSHIIDPDNLINEGICAIKKNIPNIGIITDVALDPFTIHGHDGILCDGEIVNDETIELISHAAVIQADAGADIIAPSEMMDGRVQEIRKKLDSHGHINVGIMPYVAKFNSSFYGPYRDAISTRDLLKGDKKTYYLDPANVQEAIREASIDIQESADMLLVKPGLPYLDVCFRIKEKFGLPTFAYQVSGEYAMIKAASLQGWINKNDAMMESLLAFKRAGCDGIFTYFAMEAARILTHS
ncbi:porphobilinogen synthase [Candidatus Liberibacter asiaticus]|nr:porphobilinogen synthase [Candidatus Liberibacter asiaticus]ALK07756.1 porphobilinogen synthase [Candidatus Liberibacter asiaticus]AWL14541.1 porphobilinogen synthase [Candidatus Liberibacter asiaticus]KAE9510489.1 Delta-aminolevulinic acid dehydratase [Candidatus Liberibacter asiaticus]KAE9511195.1 Delta-aminolevulinic acid dehydratase [Candidatus Liberibacter asiaticus]KAE9512564.1 Delta-aminolevulinic acid dehydratase [Candidatus Liberibacter asiaticus]